MDDGGVNRGFVHQGDGLFRGKVGYLPVGLVAGQAGSPGVDLGVNDLHGALFLRHAPTTATASISIMKSGPARRVTQTVVLVGVATPK